MNRNQLVRSAAAFGVGLTLIGVAAAQTASSGIFVDMRPLAEGESTARDHLDWISAGSFQWGFGVGVSSPLGSSQRLTSKPSVSDIVWTQAVDTSFPSLMGAVLKGARVDDGKFDFVLPQGDAKPTPYMSIAVDNSRLTGVSLSNDSASVSLGVGKFKLDHTIRDKDGRLGQKVSVEYDAKANKAIGPLTRKAAPGGGNGGAQAGIYLRLGSGNNVIAGDDASLAYHNWIRIDSVQMGVGMAFDLGGNVRSVPSVSELTFTQSFDSSVPFMLNNLLRGNEIDQAVIEFVRSEGGGKAATFMQLVLEEVIFSGLSLSTGGDLASVSASLNFTRFSQTVWGKLEKTDKTRSKTSVGYDIANAKALENPLTVLGADNFGQGALLAAASQSGLPGPAPTPIPEPQTWALLLAGLGMLAWRARRPLNA